MPKFSIIIPVYDVEKYIKKCLDSVFNQTYNNYEVIVVNDGTKDNSMEIVKNYNVITINQNNQGLSMARNNGVKKAKGEYLLFLDSDDYLEENTLEEINKALDSKPDIVRFQIKEVGSEVNKNYPEEPFNNLNGENAFKRIVNYHFVENAWCYAIKREYYMDNHFEFKKGTIHEDFGLIPLVIIKAKQVTSIPYIGYNYLQRPNSIMGDKDYNKTLKKVEDMYNHYNYLLKEINNTSLDKTYFKSYIANSILLKICDLKNKDYKKYLKKLKKEKIFTNLLTDTLARKIKKILISISPKIYFKLFR